MHDTLPLLLETDFPRLSRRSLGVVQVNLGYRCNQTCVHCHVNAGPRRQENMSRETAEQVLELVRARGPHTVDVTGGAPELHDQFRFLVEGVRELGVREVLDRCNLTILEQQGQEDLAEFLAAHRVTIIASLPCYSEDNVDAQRGKGVFHASIRSLRRLNALGYGRPGSGLVLNLVFNPQGAVLPPPQAALEADYKAHLRREHGGEFNQLLGLPLRVNGGGRLHAREVAGMDLSGAPIMVAGHCYGCTAGHGSSCGGALG